ncbi:uncharacterized protein TNCV_833201 [Trichonephila clavipes]|nr:uncharacterized protein TNCV_833201 [Trichonephila clavipes]
MNIQLNNSKRKLKTARNSTPRKVVKIARLLNKPEDEVNPPKVDLAIRETFKNQPPLLGKEDMNINNGNFIVDNAQPVLEVMDNAQPVLEVMDNAQPDLEAMDIDNVEPVLEDNPTDLVELKGNPAVDHFELVLEDNPAADHDIPAAVELDNNDIDAVVVDNYEEPEKDEKDEFYPNKAYARKTKPIQKLDTEQLLEDLGKHWKVYEYFRSFSPPPYHINETLSRKPVTCVANFQGLEGVVAHKLDGTFGLVYSFPNYIKEKWEGGIHKIHKGITLGDGIVFSAEKLSNGTVVLLDVYQVRGFPTVQWNREIVLTNFLQHLSLPEGYETQKYYHRIEDLPMIRNETDGYIIHDTKTDKIVKVKHTHSLDVVYMDGFFGYPARKNLVYTGVSKHWKKDCKTDTCMKCRLGMETYYENKMTDLLAILGRKLKIFWRNNFGKGRLFMKLSR